MLTLHDLAPILDIALSAGGLQNLDHVEESLAANGWTEGPTEFAESSWERSWRVAEPPHGGSAWAQRRPSGSSFGLIIEASSLITAHALHDALRDRISVVERLLAGPLDEVWSTWTDGALQVLLAVHAGSSAKDQVIPPTVQLSIELANQDSRED